MKSYLRKCIRNSNNLVDFKSRSLVNSTSDATALHKSIVVHIDNGYVFVVIPTGCPVEPNLSRLFKTHHYHDFDEIEQVIKNSIKLINRDNSFDNTLTVYTYCAMNPEGDKENIFKAGYIPDLTTTYRAY